MDVVDDFGDVLQSFGALGISLKLALLLGGLFVGSAVPALGQVRRDDTAALGAFVALQDATPDVILLVRAVDKYRLVRLV